MNPAPKPEPKQKRRKGLRRDTPKAAERRKEWAETRDRHLTANPRCEGPSRGLQGSCMGGLQAHHVIPRSAGGTRNEHGPLVSLCLAHHEHLERNRAEAKALGLLMRRV